jgi:hypothetical protein
MSQQPKKKAAGTRPMTGSLPKKGTTGQLKKGKGKPRKKKKAGMGVMAQVIGGLSLLVVVGGVAATGIYLADRALPKEGQHVTPGAVARPSIKPTIDGVEPRRNGYAIAPEDEVYAHQASDVAKTPLEPPVNGLLAKEVLTVFADGKFRPQMPVSRAEFVNWCYNAVMVQSARPADPFTKVAKAFTSVEASGEEFEDVPAEHWAANVLSTLQGAKLLEGKAFRPDMPLTREEWAMFASLFAAGQDERQALKAPIEAKKLMVAYRGHNFTDFDALKAPTKPYVYFVFSDPKRAKWLEEAFTLPDSPGPWGPGKPVTRGEAAAWLGSVFDTIGVGI